MSDVMVAKSGGLESTFADEGIDPSSEMTLGVVAREVVGLDSSSGKTLGVVAREVGKLRIIGALGELIVRVEPYPWK